MMPLTGQNKSCDFLENKQSLYFVRPFKEKNEVICRLRMLSKELKWLCKQKEAQQLFLLICINLAGTVLLLIWCRLTSSLALLAFTYLSWFNFLSLLTCLLCVWVEAQLASMSYTYGLMQSEVLAVFSSITLTLVGALFILKDCVERIIQPEQLHMDKVSAVAFIGLLLNLVMTAFAYNSPLSHVLRASPSSILQEHFADMCHSLCFYIPGLQRLLLPRINPLVLVSLTGFGFIVGDQIVVQVYNYPRGDTVVAFIIALFTISTMYPLCVCSAKLLLQTIPSHFSAHLDKCLREALTIDGVLEFRKENFWVLGVGIKPQKRLNTIQGGDMTGSVVSGSLHVRVRRDANEQLVLNQVQSRLKSIVPLLTVQVFKDDWTRNATTLQLLSDSSLPFVRSPFQLNPREVISADTQGGQHSCTQLREGANNISSYNVNHNFCVSPNSNMINQLTDPLIPELNLKPKSGNLSHSVVDDNNENLKFHAVSDYKAFNKNDTNNFKSHLGSSLPTYSISNPNKFIECLKS